MRGDEVHMYPLRDTDVDRQNAGRGPRTDRRGLPGTANILAQQPRERRLLTRPGSGPRVASP